MSRRRATAPESTRGDPPGGSPPPSPGRARRTRPGRAIRPELRQVRLVPDLERRASAKMPGRRAGERGKRRASALGRRRKSVLVEPVAVVQDEQRPNATRLEGIEEAIPDREVVPPRLWLGGAPGEVDANPAHTSCGHHLCLLVRVAIPLDRDAE